MDPRIKQKLRVCSRIFIAKRLDKYSYVMLQLQKSEMHVLQVRRSVNREAGGKLSAMASNKKIWGQREKEKALTSENWSKKS